MAFLILWLAVNGLLISAWYDGFPLPLVIFSIVALDVVLPLFIWEDRK